MAHKRRDDYFGEDSRIVRVSEGETRQFSMDGNEREPAEMAEERSSLRDYTLPALLWKFGRPALLLILSAALVVWLGFTAYGYVKSNYFDPAGADPSAVKTVQIKTGSSLSTIASKLYDEGIIRNKFVFQMYADFNDKGSKMQAGTYQLSPAMTMDEIIAVLSAGDGGRKVIKITFTEGMTIEDMANTLADKGVFNADKKDEFLKLCNDPYNFSGDYDFIALLVDDPNLQQRKYALEGYLFPDTYEIYADATPEVVIKKLLDRFNNIFTLDYEGKAKELDMSVDQVMALASMIEWEGLPQDFKKISSVFHNRLKTNMPMQSGATLRYITGNKKLFYTDEELKIESPYNTENNKGLPIGAVCNPGKQAIEAALFPDEQFVKDKYLYFCNEAPDSGKLVFAKTLKEHNANVAHYRELEAAQASASPSPSK